MSLLAVPIIAVLALFLVLLSSTVLFVYLVKLKNRVVILNLQMQSTSLLVNDLQSINQKIQQEFDVMVEESAQLAAENVQVSKQLEHRIKSLQQQAIDQKDLLAQWQENQGQDKFYNRAFKLAAKGADIEEIMSECELPRAEVEMLLSVYQQRSRSL
jgi:regulator of replication initiation timing